MSEKSPFRPVPTALDFPKYEAEILELWKAGGIFEKSIAQREGGRDYVFYEGPPTANGMPHNGHVLTRVNKDLFPRYQAMLGAKVLRKAGWDTHGLPVEVEVEKELHIHGKEAIQAYGVRPFVGRCIDSVFRYTAEWERLTERLGFWVSMQDAYVTYHKSYIESVWWALSELFKQGLLYQGHKVVWWWAQGGTALSAGEVGQGYKTVDDPSVYCLFPLENADGSRGDDALVVWTTTPWTLPSNGYAAVRAEFEYVYVSIGEALASPGGGGGKGKAKAPQPLPSLAAKRLVVAAGLREQLEQKLGHHLVVERTVLGAELVGLRYQPPFDLYYADLKSSEVQRKDGSQARTWWRVIAEEFVTLDSGTGIVHVAPAFGEDDHAAHKRQLDGYAQPEAVELICAIKPDGTFKAELSAYAGQWVKDADPLIIQDLTARQLMLLSETYRHDYPFCWRADQDPLIQMARPGWFIRTTAKLDAAKANNQAVNWLPDHIKDGRFGDFLDNNVDWALSRERFWGTPLNVWICGACDHRSAPNSAEQILALNPKAFDHWHADKAQHPDLNEHLMLHKPWIDEVTLPCEKCGAQMKRVPDVIDCWFDSGCMPFAQWGFPHVEGSKARFDNAFPADFISEAIDQTRGWFYSLLMIATLVFDKEAQERLGLSRVRDYPLPYKTCIVLGHVGDREGKKESKSKGNYTPPEIIIDRVAMDFAVLSEAYGQTAAEGEIYVARDDLEGMDLSDGARVALYHVEKPALRRQVKILAHKRLPRRVALISPADRLALGLVDAEQGLAARPVEVPNYPADQRVRVEDEATPAPGADAFRWFFFASSPPWNNTRHSLRNVRMLQKDFVVKLRNVYSFFTIYANIDGWSPTQAAHAGQPEAKRSVLDRWMLGELNIATRKVRAAMDSYLAYDAALALQELVEALSNWYVRRSRNRFWAAGLEQDKRDAYATLYAALLGIAKLSAPFVPFFAEEMFQNLAVHAGLAGAKESVHLEDYPVADPALIDLELAEEMAAVREIVSLGLSVRAAGKLKVRQPLARADVVLNNAALKARIEAYADLIREELNVHELRTMHPGHEEGAVSFNVNPNFRALGPRLGKQVQAVKQALAKADGNALFAELAQHGKVVLEVAGQPMELSGEEIAVNVSAADGFAAETGRVGVVVLHTTLTDELVDEGYLREVMSRVQAARKEKQLGFSDRVGLRVGGSQRIQRIVQQHAAHIQAECLVTELVWDASEAELQTVGDEALSVKLV